ncbi:hypothetical protein PPL_08933 [Heterostelium album PN500]|uniref:Uncharacterized protein n=1 Tax=Heterostelium pallidum (strain ATCC 26659 / Pp 5 / PN500) TaxID=670386 RepID=D3BK52_HETP5|nr:hypothetical protein PPL_08933 [Heterostelium album PN500]EFA78282.1 hypothetical protein PPL_08933 [Heterostelium album PN500]|eukprot:XP_020430407.1 hypothetical protein PPL_08933 [Heterostelium album PN500]
MNTVECVLLDQCQDVAIVQNTVIIKITLHFIYFLTVICFNYMCVFHDTTRIIHPFIHIYYTIPYNNNNNDRMTINFIPTLKE